MTTITDLSAVHRIQDELKTLSPQELRLVEIAIRDLQKDCTVSEHSTKDSEEEDDDFDLDEILNFTQNLDLDKDLNFDENGWLHPKPGVAGRLLKLCRKYMKNRSDEECEQLKLERILKEKAK
ncbi:MAG: hypothetical protein LBF88_06035 [Planctomycetaceae bacterium]|jgi:hypothetical protein|nr:hypothetical protein [Planctomycetaceae bacterium]